MSDDPIAPARGCCLGVLLSGVMVVALVLAAAAMEVIR